MSYAQPFPEQSTETKTRWLKQATPVSQGIWANAIGRPSALSYADRALNELLGYAAPNGSAPIGYATVTRARAILAGGVARDSIYPAITPTGDGGLNLFWKAGSRSIEIELEPGHHHFLRIVSADGAVAFEEESDGAFPRERFRAALAEMTGHVEFVNPVWRDLFAK